MLTLAFFPWLQLKEEYRFPDFQILSYQRGSFPGSTPSEQKAIDDALSSYHARTGRPLDRASILQHRSQSTPTAELNTAYRADLVVYADLIAFAGLSARTFFNPLCYSNRDAFRLVVQDIPESARNLLITSRRRDGETNLCYMDGSYIARPPEHVMQDHAPLDPTVLVALLEAQAHDDWPELFRAIALFNEANTDRAEIPIATEVILTYAALEQALGVAGKPVNKVAMAFENEFKPSEPLPNKDWFDPQRD